MPTYFETKRSFVDVTITPNEAVAAATASAEQSESTTQKIPGIDTKEFLEAAEGVVGVFVLMNSTALSLVQNDLQGNIDKLRERCEKFPKTSSTLEEIVKDEDKQADGKSKKERQKIKRATEALLWLTRGLWFTCEGLRISREKKDQTLSASFQAAFKTTLEQYHTFLTKNVILIALKASPSRQLLYSKLGGVDEGEAASVETSVSEELGKWLSGLEKIVKHIQAFYASEKYDADFL